VQLSSKGISLEIYTEPNLPLPSLCKQFRSNRSEEKNASKVNVKQIDAAYKKIECRKINMIVTDFHEANVNEPFALLRCRVFGTTGYIFC
jgi:hypothetical protein